MNLRKDSCLHSLHADGIVSLGLNFKMQFSYRLLIVTIDLKAEKNDFQSD